MCMYEATRLYFTTSVSSVCSSLLPHLFQTLGQALQECEAILYSRISKNERSQTTNERTFVIVFPEVLFVALLKSSTIAASAALLRAVRTSCFSRANMPSLACDSSRDRVRMTLAREFWDVLRRKRPSADILR